MKVKWFRISLVFTYKKWNTGALHGHLQIQNFPSLLEGLFTRTQLTGLVRLLGRTSPWVHMGNFSPVSEMRKGQRCWGRVLALNSKNKANKAKHKNLTFTPIIASATLKAISLQLQWDAYDMENTPRNARRCNPDCQNSFCIHPDNWAEVFIW